jgi:hypothetical protein
MVLAAKITSGKGYYMVWTCAKIASTLTNNATLLLDDFPSCASYVDGSNLDQVSVVAADFNGKAANVGAALNMSFGMGLWLSLCLHALGVEIYVSQFPDNFANELANIQIVASHSQRGRAT